MKHLVLSLCLLLIGVATVGAQVPYVSCVVAQGAFQGNTQQNLDLWVAAEGKWFLFAKGPPGVHFVDVDGVLTSAGVLCSGEGWYQGPHQLETHFDLSLLEMGKDKVELEIKLEGAQGILGLPFTSDYWILPLNNSEVYVQRDGIEHLPLTSGEWFLLEAGDLLFSGEEQVLFQGQVAPLQLLQSGLLDGSFWWDPPGLSLEAGDEAVVRVKLQGPQKAGNLVLHAGKHVELGTKWSLNGNKLTVISDSGHGLVLQVPHLSPGVHELTGTLIALLPPKRGESVVTALWQGREAQLPIHIDRSWFDFDSLHYLQIDVERGSASLIMPSGNLRSVRGKPVISLPNDGLNLVIPVDHPEKPLWIGFPVAESIVREIEASQPQNASPDFFMPVFLWDQGFSWRLVTASQNWFLDATAERQLLRGKLGTVQVEAAPSGIFLSKHFESVRQDEAWHWQETIESHQGTWRSGPWLCNIDVPKEDGKVPGMAVSYRGENWFVSFTPTDVVLKYADRDWVLGTRLSSRSVWLSWDQVFRLEFTPQRLSFSYQYGEGRTINLRSKGKQGFRLHLTHGPWEAYLGHSVNESSLGLRFKHAQSQERWLSLSKLACEAKNQTLLLELNQQLGYRLTSWCTLYVEGSLGVSRYLDLNYGAGVILTPLPQVIATVGWHSDLGWQTKVGVAVPFVGRKTVTECE
ncbi:MAG: hypothetical protein GX971_07675 [Firmicutes bacterium]|nr:hypothetical protein [Bacillota bacterium]